MSGEPGRLFSGVSVGDGGGGGAAGCWLVVVREEVAADDDVAELDEEAEDELLLDAAEVVEVADAEPDSAFASLPGGDESVCLTALPASL